MVDPHRLLAAYETCRLDLLAERNDQGCWTGELSASALSTATAISALAIDLSASERNLAADHPVKRLVERGLEWLVTQQNSDGGWGDTDRSYSNIATTMLCAAAIHLAGMAERYAKTLLRANRYCAVSGQAAGGKPTGASPEIKDGIPALRKRYGKDKTFVVPILTNCALAGLVDWKDVAPLPFELACVPQKWYRLVNMPVVSYAIPALVAIGQARHFHKPSRNPLMRGLRTRCVQRSLGVLEKMQPKSGGYLEAVPLTSFVVMSLASTGRREHSVTRNGIRFLIESVRPDGSWPIDTNLATWVTTLSLNALAGAGEDVGEFECLQWLLSCQHRQQHPFTGADPGGFGWTDLSGAVPDSDDTPGALLALDAIRKSPRTTTVERAKILESAAMALTWLLDLQNDDGGWPTFCRGWGKLPFDRSGADLTAHALRAMRAWQDDFHAQAFERASLRAFRYLDRQQQPDGSWFPLWFGNQEAPNEVNLVYGTAKVLLAYTDWNQREARAAKRGRDALLRLQRTDGSWGSAGMREAGALAETGSFEETALAIEALIAWKDVAAVGLALDRGLEWLVTAVEEDRHLRASPIGFYFAKLWYYESAYPLVFSVAALGRAVSALVPESPWLPSRPTFTTAGDSESGDSILGELTAKTAALKVSSNGPARD
jgi:squalene-hopene/tetraprenyl-beta-curcumene cyclase